MIYTQHEAAIEAAARALHGAWVEEGRGFNPDFDAMPKSVQAMFRRYGKIAYDAARSERPMSDEQIAQEFHEMYERLAQSFGCRTREASAKPWSEIPDPNRKLMRAVVGELRRGGVLDAVRSWEARPEPWTGKQLFDYLLHEAERARNPFGRLSTSEKVKWNALAARIEREIVRTARSGEAEDGREWTLRWDHRQLKHYIDGPSDGRQIEGLVVVPKSELERARAARSGDEPERLAAIEACDSVRELIVKFAKVGDKEAGEWLDRHLNTIRSALDRAARSGEAEGERGYVPTTAERALVGQLRTDVEVEREGRHSAEDLLLAAVTSLRSIASAEPKSDQARWMVAEAKRGIPKGAEPRQDQPTAQAHTNGDCLPGCAYCAAEQPETGERRSMDQVIADAKRIESEGFLPETGERQTEDEEQDRVEAEAQSDENWKAR